MKLKVLACPFIDQIIQDTIGEDSDIIKLKQYTYGK